MRHKFILRTVLTLALMNCSFSASANNPEYSATEILNAVKFREDGQTRKSKFHLKLTSKSGFERSREITLLEQDDGADLKSFIYIHKPADVQGTGVMLHAFDDNSAKQDDIWLYIPAMRKVKRLSAKNKRGRFVSSELSYADLERLQLQDFEYHVEGVEDIDGTKTVKILANVANENAKYKTGYAKKTLWVDTERDILLKEVYFDEQGMLLKTRRVKTVEKIDSFWTVTHLEVENHQTGDKTDLFLDKISYNVPVSKTQFSKVSLKRGL